MLVERGRLCYFLSCYIVAHANYTSSASYRCSRTRVMSEIRGDNTFSPPSTLSSASSSSYTVPFLLCSNRQYELYQDKALAPLAYCAAKCPIPKVQAWTTTLILSSSRPRRIPNNPSSRFPKPGTLTRRGDEEPIKSPGQDVRTAESGGSKLVHPCASGHCSPRLINVFGQQCGQGVPCANCSRRGEYCKPPRISNWASVLTSMPRSMPTQPLLPNLESTNTAVNLAHLKLFHHFQAFTQQTLLLGHEVWSNTLQLCFEFDFLMNAILCIAARHLAVLQPQNLTYPTAATSHLCRALSRFRTAVSKDLTSTHIDAFIATSLLLQYELWTNADITSPPGYAGEIAFDQPPKDHLFTFCSSLKQVFLKGISAKSGQLSVFLPKLQHNPKDALVRAARISCDTIDQCQRFFSWDRPVGPDLLELSFPYKRSLDSVISNVWQSHVPRLSADTTNPVEDGYMPVITQLCLILSFLPEARPPELVDVDSNLFSDLSKFILSFPIVCHGPYISMVQESDPHALLLLYHFYRAVRILMPIDKCWWAHARAAASEQALKEWLIIQGAKQGDT